ncbi:Poly(RC)-binding protein 3 [Tolypocladium paradoxum]|uniref:Poly(RC)-binding protein 3 n=1 Tax=Tolypocladium paradoxum TaxID=94208 RepID=A0A2S4L1Q7_9HYPO|nr:Poly(RC)-binding protein 3 [Tolypocladium paradoxum]
MSASPPQPTQSAKRPLEEASSPSRATDQPDAKRPALDKVIKNDDEVEAPETAIETPGQDINENANGVQSEKADAAATTTAAAAAAATATAPAVPANIEPAVTSAATNDETAWIHIRAVISSPEAATIIGKGGENVSNIRKMSGAKCTVSDYQKGAVERILTVSGIVDAAFGLIIRTLNNEPLNEKSTTASKTYPLRLLIPHLLIGSIIGKGGARIKEIQDASGARLNASDSCLPMSSERSLVVMGVADAVHIATYYVGSTLLEQLNERFGGPAASAYATRSGAPAGAIPGGMQVVPYSPQPAGGLFGRADHYGRHQDRRGGPQHMPPAPYQQQYAHGAAQPNPAMPIHYGAQPAAYGAAPHVQPHMPHHGGPQPHGGPQGQAMHAGMPGGPITQQIFIPNDMVGAIIGKGGQKINEIRQLSGSVIKINEPQDNSNERLVTVTGTEECNRMALYLLYSRLESEKHRV